jgi:hypothetical protein
MTRPDPMRRRALQALHQALRRVEQLPPTVGYFLAVVDDALLALDIVAYTEDDFWTLARLFHKRPRTVDEEVIKQERFLHITFYLERPSCTP